MIEKDIQTAFENEMQVRKIISEQARNGVLFDERKARAYIEELEQRKQELFQRIRPLLQLEVIRPYDKYVDKVFTLSGVYSAITQRWFGDDVENVWGQFSRVIFEEPDLGSRQKLQSQLLRLGWKPRAFTDKGSPKLTVDGEPCPSLRAIGTEVGQWVADWYTYNHRQSQIQGWLDRLRSDSRLSAEAITIGTPTFRMRHRTVVNVPKAASHVLFGKEMRSLFVVPESRIMVGHDASGLELRMLAHYLNREDYIKIVSEQDPHNYHKDLLLLDNRDKAKEFIYKFNYGAGGLLIGMSVYSYEEIYGKYSFSDLDSAKTFLKQRANKYGFVDIGKKTYVPITEEICAFFLAGNELKNTFLENNPGLQDLIKDVQDAAKERGFLIGLDGRKILLRRDVFGKIQVHKALNTLMQSAGAVVMKHSIVLLDNYIKKEGLSSKRLIEQHDEGQFECLPEEAEEHGKLAVKSIVEAGKLLGVRCPLDGEYKIGRNWSETH